VPVWFSQVVGDVEDFLRGADSALAEMISEELGLDEKDVEPVARAAAWGFAKEMEGRWREFYYLDVSGHRFYYSDTGTCTIWEADLERGLTRVYTLRGKDEAYGLAVAVLEEWLGAIADRLSRRFGLDRAEVEGRLRGMLERLKSDPGNVVKAGFARFVLTPPDSEEEIRRGLAMYTGGQFQDEGLARAWRRVVFRGRENMVTIDIIDAYLVGKGVGYRLPERFKVYEREDGAMMSIRLWRGWRVVWYKRAGGAYRFVGIMDLRSGSGEALREALEDLVAEDYVKGRPARAIWVGVKAARSSRFADFGRPDLARAVYMVARDRKVYAKVEGGLEEGVAVHVLRDPDRGVDDPHAYLFIVEHGDERRLLDYGAVEHVLRRSHGRLAAAQEEYGALVDEEELAERLAGVLRRRRALSELPEGVASWLREYVQSKRQDRGSRGAVSSPC